MAGIRYHDLPHCTLLEMRHCIRNVQHALRELRIASAIGHLGCALIVQCVKPSTMCQGAARPFEVWARIDGLYRGSAYHTSGKQHPLSLDNARVKSSTPSMRARCWRHRTGHSWRPAARNRLKAPHL